MSLTTPVHRLVVYDPDAGVDAVLSDLLRMELPAEFPDAIAAVGVEHSGNSDDVRRLLRNGRVLSRDQLATLLSQVSFSYGWFFFGVRRGVGEPVPPVNVPALLSVSAFVVDIMEGRWLGIATLLPAVAQAAGEIILRPMVLDPIDLSELKLMY